MMNSIPERIQKEIDEFYKENPEISYNKKYYNINSDENIKRDILNPNGNKNWDEIREMKSENSIYFTLNLTNDRQTNIKGNYKSDGKKERQDIFLQKENGTSKHESNITDMHWPKFDDILLAMGKRYDWKNDRWIKLKERKKKFLSTSNNRHRILDFFSKHKFSYRSVKLNRSKTKRNLVIAVSAVR